MKIIAITPQGKKDTLASMIIEGFNDLKYEVIASSPGNNVIKSYGDNEIIAHSQDADYIFAFWGKVKGVPPPKYYLLNYINKPEKTVYIDGSEWTATGFTDNNKQIYASWSNKNMDMQKFEAKHDSRRCKGTPWLNEEMHAYCKWYFKRECYPEDRVERNVHPLNVGCNNNYFDIQPNSNKDIDILWSFGHIDTGLRSDVTKVCLDLKKEGYAIEFIGGGLDIAPRVSKEKYKEFIQRSHIGISAWGAGNSCMRLFEISAAGTCCFAQRTEIDFINKPADMKDYVEYSTIDEFDAKIRTLLNNKDLCRQIGTAGRQHMLKFHSPAARVKHIMGIINR